MSQSQIKDVLAAYDEHANAYVVKPDDYDEFLSLLVDRAGKIVIGSQMDYGTDLGPLVSRSQVETVERYVALLESLCRESPYNWFNFFDFWTDDAAAETAPP